MPSSRVVKLLVSIAFTVFAYGCSTENPRATEPAPVPLASTSAPVPPPVPAPQRAMLPVVPDNPLHDPNNVLAKRSVYYAHDQYKIAPEYRPVVEAHAKYLLNHSGATIRIQGNTDEQGGREYNLSLGQRRADNVMQLMKVLGVPERQMESVSLGEEKPQAADHDETAWSQNRRSDILYDREN